MSGCTKHSTLQITSIFEIFIILFKMDRIGLDLALRSNAATPRTKRTSEFVSISRALSRLFLFVLLSPFTVIFGDGKCG